MKLIDIFHKWLHRKGAIEKDDTYRSADDSKLRQFCVEQIVKYHQSSCNNYYAPSQEIALEAEQLRNYIRFGVPYRAHWHEDKDGE